MGNLKILIVKCFDSCKKKYAYINFEMCFISIFQFSGNGKVRSSSLHLFCSEQNWASLAVLRWSLTGDDPVLCFDVTETRAA